MGTKGILENVKTGDVIGLDALDGFVYVNPDEETVKMLEAKAAAFAEEKEALKMMVNAKSITTDGHEVELAGNIGGFKDVEGVLKNGGEGVGLFRTEFLYMDNDHFPRKKSSLKPTRLYWKAWAAARWLSAHWISAATRSCPTIHSRKK